MGRKIEDEAAESHIKQSCTAPDISPPVAVAIAAATALASSLALPICPGTRTHAVWTGVVVITNDQETNRREKSTGETDEEGQDGSSVRVELDLAACQIAAVLRGWLFLCIPFFFALLDGSWAGWPAGQSRSPATIRWKRALLAGDWRRKRNQKQTHALVAGRYSNRVAG
ncbi:uncharacterized protein ARB_03962 [Trichophyton benhamiae CBS 112371]|uniref:Uncharacterized protein n=1 Tax=Arthroderma benhamiae (strain ATCC MYA-4681 / CBS 112371) TaxID=663331 RepID=D4AKD6_ARTBC|nr:uncharacterized protein ARB_03962 [Trichophyton benhamiae CBS 112371]EFE36441.1 hypothetical protein ARB_03962 [Trichophyton benhamiae CBS 112371]